MHPFEPIMSALSRNWDMVDSAISGMDDSELARQPNSHSNSAAWTLWHMNRVLDTFLHQRFRDLPQLWTRDGWAGRFSMAPDPDDRGVGWTAEQVAAWAQPSPEVQLGYYEAIKAATMQYLGSVSEAEIAREIVFPPSPEPQTMASAVAQMTWDNVAHGGQIAYIRGYLKGMGWHR